MIDPNGSRRRAHLAGGGGLERAPVELTGAADASGATNAAANLDPANARRDPADPNANEVNRQHAVRALSGMPIVFEANRGQWNTTSDLVGRARGLLAGFGAGSIQLDLTSKPAGQDPKSLGIRLRFANASDRAPHGESKLAGYHNYLRGNDPAKWRTHVELFEQVRYDELYPGVSLVVGDREGRLEYDLELASASSLEQVRVDCEGIDSIEIGEAGDLRMNTAIGTLCQTLPKSWYAAADGTQRPADCRFRVLGTTSYGFEVMNPEEGSRLVVDPGLNWSTFLGGSDQDWVYGVAFLNGLLTAVGGTGSSDFSTTNGTVQQLKNTGRDAFVTQMNPAYSGSAQLLWSTFLGGSAEDEARGVAVSSDGRVSLCGYTYSQDFPTTLSAPLPGAPGPAGTRIAFVTRLESLGTSLQYSTYFGGSGASKANAIAIDSTPIITVVGSTGAPGNLPLVNAYDTTFDGGSTDAFVAQLDPNLTGLGSIVYSTYLGGGNNATGYDEAFAVDVEGLFIYIGGSTASPGFNTTLNAFGPNFGGGALDGFVMKLRPSATPINQVKFASFLGGAADDEVFGLVVNSSMVNCCGYTFATNFPLSSVLAGGSVPYQSNNGGGSDAFMTQINSQNIGAFQLVYSTYFGGAGNDIAYSIARVASQCDLIVGSTTAGVSNNLPVGPTGVVYDETWNGATDAFMTRLYWANGRAGAAQLTYSTYLGGSTTIPVGGTNGAQDTARSVVLDGNNAYLGGFTTSSDFPVAGNPLQPTWHVDPGGSVLNDGFLCTFSLPALSFP